MTRWADVDPKTRMWIGVFIVVVVVLIIAGWYGYFSTGG